MSIRCDFCNEVNSLQHKGVVFVHSNKTGTHVCICDECIADAAETVKKYKNSEAPAARTDEASVLSETTR